jgi:hypothetical protein
VHFHLSAQHTWSQLSACLSIVCLFCISHRPQLGSGEQEHEKACSISLSYFRVYLIQIHHSCYWVDFSESLLVLSTVSFNDYCLQKITLLNLLSRVFFLSLEEAVILVWKCWFLITWPGNRWIGWFMFSPITVLIRQ